MRALIVPLVLFIAAAPSSARADDREACLDAYVAAQKLKKDKHLIEAREQLLVCMRDVCPQVARAGCAGWLTEVQQSLPTAVFSAFDGSGHARADVALRIDGAPVRQRLDGEAIAIDPGVHHVRWEASGEAPIEQDITVREGLKNQQFEARFPLRTAAPKPTYHRKNSPWMFVLAGVGVLGGAGFGVFGLMSLHDENQLRAQCKPNCSPSQVASVRHEELAADVSLGIGIVAAASAVVLFLTRPKVADAPRPPATATARRPELGHIF